MKASIIVLILFSGSIRAINKSYLNGISLNSLRVDSFGDLKIVAPYGIYLDFIAYFFCK